MKTTIIILAMLYPYIGKAYQNTSPPFSIGDNLPPVFISNIINHNSASVNLSEYNNKLLVLDFMATTCASCIKLLPRFDSLQKKYQNNLQFFLVSPEKKEKLISFLSRNSIAKKTKLPVIVQDSMLKSWFPHKFISHEVWIYKGKVIAITKGEHVTAANIEAVLNGKEIKLPVKTDRSNYDYTQPLLSFNGNIEPQQPIYYSGFCASLPDFTRGYNYKKDSTTGTQRFIFINYNLQQFFLKSHRLPLSYPQQFIEWNKDNKSQQLAYCYEAVLPISMNEEQCREKIRSDIKTYFNLTSRIEKRDTTYLIITPNNSPE
jgi:thiol-disulfide isomerase/thioredoxin